MIQNAAFHELHRPGRRPLGLDHAAVGGWDARRRPGPPSGARGSGSALTMAAPLPLAGDAGKCKMHLYDGVGPSPMTAMTPSSQPVHQEVAVDAHRSTVDWDEDSWRHQAACRSTEADLFFPLRRSRGALEQIRAAKSVCWSCEVRETCLQYALETNQEAGIWGGTSEDERRKLRRAWLARGHGVSAWIT